MQYYIIREAGLLAEKAGVEQIHNGTFQTPEVYDP
jgi:hypothetical protein